MKRPKRYLVGMGFLSLAGFFGTGGVTIFSAGLLSFVALFTIGVMITSGPMMYLLWKDITALRRRGLPWGPTRWAYYLLAIVFPAWVMTPIYYLSSSGKIEKHLEADREAEAIYDAIVEDLPPLSKCRWSRSQINRLSDSQFNHLIYLLVEEIKKEAQEENQTIELLSYPPETSQVEFLLEEDGIIMFSTSKRDIEDTLQNDPQSLFIWFDERSKDHNINADLRLLLTDSKIRKEDAVHLLKEYGIIVFGNDNLRRELEDAGISPDRVM